MSTYETAPDSLDVYADLPASFPPVSVSVQLGEKLRKEDLILDIDVAVVRQIMLDQGVSDDIIDSVPILIGYAHQVGFNGKDRSFHIGRNGGEASMREDVEGYRAYAIRVNLSNKEIDRRETDRIQGSLVHEARHISDYQGLSRDELIRIARLTEYKGIMGGLVASTGFGAATTSPELLPEVYGVVMQNGAVKASAAIAVGGIFLVAQSYFGYRRSPLERSARQAAKDNKDSYLQAVMLRPRTGDV
jgi:hypothetical protein